MIDIRAGDIVTFRTSKGLVTREVIDVTSTSVQVSNEDRAPGWLPKRKVVSVEESK